MNFSDPMLLILLGLAAIGIISHNNTVTVAILVLLIICLTPMEQYFPWVEKQGLPIGIIILTIGVLAPIASGTLSASTVLHSFLHWKSLLAIVIGVVVSWLGGRGARGRTVSRRAGVRRLLVISGEPGWCSRQAAALCDALAGDWLWVGEQSELGVGCRPAALKTLLGCEFLHAVFDARQALSVDALAALAGTLVAGSWLVLLVPPWSRWHRLPDGDSLRWSEQPQPIATLSFTRYFRASLLADPAVELLRQNRAPQLTPLPSRPPWQAPIPRAHRRSAPVIAPVDAG